MADFQVFDTTTNKIDQVDGTPIRLGRIGIFDPTNDNLVVTALSDNVDITTGPGNDFIFAKGGINFINPGAGDNIMIGGTGVNDYILDTPPATAAASHNMIANFHVGDSINFANIPTSGFEIGFRDVISAMGPAFEVSIQALGPIDKPLPPPILTVDLVGINSSFFQDDQSVTRLTFDATDTLRFIR